MVDLTVGQLNGPYWGYSNTPHTGNLRPAASAEVPTRPRKKRRRNRTHEISAASPECLPTSQGSNHSGSFPAYQKSKYSQEDIFEGHLSSDEESRPASHSQRSNYTVKEVFDGDDLSEPEGVEQDVKMLTPEAGRMDGATGSRSKLLVPDRRVHQSPSPSPPTAASEVFGSDAHERKYEAFERLDFPALESSPSAGTSRRQTIFPDNLADPEVVPDSQWACHSGSLLFPQDSLPMGIATADADADEDDRVVSSQSQELKDEEDLLHFEAQVIDMQPFTGRKRSPIVAYESDSDHTVTRRSSVSILLRSPYMLPQSILTFAPCRLKLRSSSKTFISMSTSKSRHRKIASRVKMLTISAQCHKTLGGFCKRLAMGLAARSPRDPRR